MVEYKDSKVQVLVRRSCCAVDTFMILSERRAGRQIWQGGEVAF